MPKPRQPNPHPTVVITIRTSPAIQRDLDMIVASGYFGSTRSEAAERLLTEAMRNLLKEGTLLRKRPADL